MKLYLEGSQRIIQEDKKEYVLEYYLVEENSKYGKDESVYGIKIIQYSVLAENSDYTAPISYSKDLVKQIIHTLWANSVTLTSMIEIVDELISE